MAASHVTSPAPDATARANRLTEDHLYLVTHVVNQLAARYPRHVDRQELWAAGAAGLVDASRRFDPTAGAPFARYATIRIRGAIIDSTRSRDWATRSLRRRARELAETGQGIEQELGRTPTVAELAGALGVSEADVRERQESAERATLLQLDQPASNGEDGMDTLESMLPETDANALPEDALENRELLGSMRVAVEHLDQPHREVVERYFFGGELLQEIAASLGVTEARVSQIRSEAILAMRAWLATRYEGVPTVAPDAPGSRRRAAYVASMQAHTSWHQCLDAADTPLRVAQSA